MEEIIFKEVITILSYFNDDLIIKIPSKVFKKLRELSKNSKAEFYIDIEKSLEQQDISEESKDIISIIYYNYIANENEKSEIWKAWNDNENRYQEKLKEKYNTENIFKNRLKENTKAESVLPHTSMVKYEKKTIFNKIKNFIKNIINCS